MAMLYTTLCYIENDDSYLMLHRIKKDRDVNAGKWIGVGGKIEQGETPEDCLVREVYEETSLSLTDYSYRGIINFSSEGWEDERIYLYTASGFFGELDTCAEGELRWVKKDQLLGLNLWEGDKIFLKLLMEDAPFFTLDLSYSGDKLVKQSIKRKST